MHSIGILLLPIMVISLVNSVTASVTVAYNTSENCFPILKCYIWCLFSGDDEGLANTFCSLFPNQKTEMLS